MTMPATRVSTAISAVVASILSLVVMVFVLTGPKDFLDLLWGSALHVAVISAVAGLIRVAFRRGGFVLSVACGVGIAFAGFLIVFSYAVSRI